jgi:hypothetical protein
VIAFPGLVTGNLEKLKVDPSKVQIFVPTPDYEEKELENAPPPDFGGPENAPSGGKGAKAAPKAPAADSGSDLEDLFKQTK